MNNCILIAGIIIQFLSWGQAAENDEVKFIAFNGGEGETSNYSHFEEEILFFNNKVFNGKGVILSAGGSNSFVTPTEGSGLLVRDINGDVKLRPTALKTAKTATASNFATEIEKLIAKPPKAVTFFFSDHGSTSELSGWHSSIEYSQILNDLDLLPPDTVVRRIHRHCFSENALTQEWEEDDDPHSLEDYLESTYPLNRCAFASSKLDEMTWDITALKWNDDRHPLNRFLSPDSHLSLDDLKKTQMDEPSTPALTTDNMVMDIIQSLCDRKSPIFKENTCPQCKANASTQPSLTQPPRVVSEVTKALIDENCANLSEVDIANKTFANDFEALNKFQEKVNLILVSNAEKFIERQKPGSKKAFIAATKIVETLYACQVVKTKCPNISVAELEKLKEKTIRPYEEKILALTESETFHALPKEFKNQVEAQIEKTKLMVIYGILKKDRKHRFTVTEMIEDVLNLPMARQKSRRMTFENRQSKIRAAVELWLKEPGQERFKSRYDNIRQCETTPINKI